jgi:hypothetical protein|tara:strand:- start:1153 stop:1746 length:594 start_codon:yes stop_codon:yes gene_type:complete
MLVIGNGESRKALKIEELNLPTVGCNAIFRDIKVDHLVCCDRRMVREAIKHSNTSQSIIYSRPDWCNEFNVFPVPDLPYVGELRQDDPWHWGTGQYALLVATKYCVMDHIHIVGFDMKSKDGFVNNIYKGSESYDASSKQAVDPSYWIYQNRKIFEHYPKQNFNFYVDQYFKIPEGWEKMSNVQILPISDIHKHIVI